ncbi:MAG: LTA synthase family protein [Gammaproteobacteria bacterium]|nr:LTA synthase family protein [Gammaproteobacteria bacterium]
MASWLGACAAMLRPLLLFALAAGAVFSGSRLLLAWHFAGHLGATAGLGEVLVRAWRFDLVVICAVCLVVVLVQWIAPGRVLQGRVWRCAMAAWLTGWFMLIVWNEAATPDFMTEFGVRPNLLYVAYLGSPREVFMTIWEAHRGALLAGIGLTALAGGLAWRTLRRQPWPAVPPWRLRLVMLAPLVLALAVGARGSTGHRPLNISFAASSSDVLVNDLALNSTYSALHALWEETREAQALRGYGRLPQAEVVARLRRSMQLPDSAFTDPQRPTLHELVPTAHPGGKPNLVILLQESLGAHYFQSLGGLPVAQALETWRDRSFWFDNLYASGTRSARGIEAVATGFLPTRTPSVLRLDSAQRDFFTLAQALKAQGYSTEFVYGGDSSFDNMRGFFLGNGFDRVVDWAELLPEAKFSTTWGVSDDDLYAWVARKLARDDASGQPHFTLVFSTSNHPPYDFPEGRIDLYEQPRQTANNAARYADHAVGRFLESASTAPYWAHTLFMVVADHESRTIGEGLVPVLSFHIPAFIAGGPVTPRVVTRLASQVDLLPTALSLMGLRVAIPAPGIDQSRSDLAGPGRAIMQFHDTAAYREGDDVEILEADGSAHHFLLRGRMLQPAPADAELRREALAMTQWPVLALRNGWYRP